MPAEKYNDCPNCQAHTSLQYTPISHHNVVTDFQIGFCNKCQKHTIREIKQQVGNELGQKKTVTYTYIHPSYPANINPAPTNMPEECKKYYEEARLIFNTSKGGAILLLRTCLESVCNHFKCKGVNLYQKAENLCKNHNLDAKNIKSVNILRNEGNIIAHIKSNQDELGDEAEGLFKLFWILFNSIENQEMIEKLYKRVPKKGATTKKDN